MTIKGKIRWNKIKSGIGQGVEVIQVLCGWIIWRLQKGYKS